MWTTYAFTTSGVCLLEVTAVGLVSKNVWASWFVLHTGFGSRRLESFANCTHIVHALQPPLRCKPQHVSTYDVCTSQADNITANPQPRQVCLYACHATSSFAFCPRQVSQSCHNVFSPQTSCRYSTQRRLAYLFAATTNDNDERQRRYYS